MSEEERGFADILRKNVYIYFLLKNESLYTFPAIALNLSSELPVKCLQYSVTQPWSVVCKWCWSISCLPNLCEEVSSEIESFKKLA